MVACGREAPSADEQRVFRGVLAQERQDSLLVFRTVRSREILGRDSVEWLDAMRPDAVAAGVPLALLSGFWHVNENAASLTEPPPVPSHRVQLTSRGHSGESTSARWVQYFSRVAFTPRRDTALVEHSSVCGSRCGSSSFMLLTLHDGTWMVVGTFGGSIY